mgnify:CR=1 FL=1
MSYDYGTQIKKFREGLAEDEKILAKLSSDENCPPSMIESIEKLIAQKKSGIEKMLIWQAEGK